MIRTAQWIGLMALLSAAAAWPQAPFAEQRPGAAPIRSAREFRGMCRRAKTADQYGALSAWCFRQSGACVKKVSELESELKEYDSGTPRVGPKYPPRDRTIRELIAYYRSQAAKWQGRADGYTKQMAKLMTPDAAR